MENFPQFRLIDITNNLEIIEAVNATSRVKLVQQIKMLVLEYETIQDLKKKILENNEDYQNKFDNIEKQQSFFQSKVNYSNLFQEFRMFKRLLKFKQKD